MNKRRTDSFICDEDYPIVEVKQGKLHGFQDGDVYCFRGIPYAKTRRFGQPEKPDAWEGVREACDYGHGCPEMTYSIECQHPSHELIMPRKLWYMSEDCTNLNIWTKSIDPGCRKPVMVWFHGGGFSGGSATQLYAYEGWEMANTYDVVLVTVNHRLNVLGFFDLEDYGSQFKNSANAGIADLVAALKWVKENIAAFGGDSDNVMIYGQSGGGGKVTTLLQTPAADGLYNKAAIQSGVMSGGPRNPNSKEIVALSLKLLGITKENIEDIVTVDFETLCAAVRQAYETFGLNPYMAWGPKEDGVFYLGSWERIGFRKENHHIPIIVGSCLAEFDPGPVGNKRRWSDARKMAGLLERYGEDAQAVRKMFIKAYPEMDWSYAAAVDTRCRMATLKFLEQRVQEAKAPIYNYLFDFESPVMGGRLPAHSGELHFMFHNAFYAEGAVKEGVTEKLQNEMAGAWAQFARTGDPNGEGLPVWPAYTSEKKSCLCYGDTTIVKENHDGELLKLVAKHEASPIAHTMQGDVKGENRDGVAIFRGIPYTGRLDGENRFLPPTPAIKWEGVRDCTKNGPIAIQFGTSISGSGDFGTYFSGKKPELFNCDSEVQDENCTVLNVLTPGIDDKKRAVVVYIHGGGFASGSGSLVLGSDTWVREEDIVVVGINHRLNVFGALYLGDLDPKYAQSGSAGMLDVVQALEWVRDNISFFGGDPDKVTIMGESGGGGKVNNLMVMEKARGLFRSVIIESGSGAPGTISKAEATTMAKALLDELGIGYDELDKLIALPPQVILEATGRLGSFMGFSPIGDDIHIPYNPEGIYKEINPGLPMLVGSSEEEIAAFAEPSTEAYTWETLREELLAPTRAARASVEAEAKAEAEGRKLWSPTAKGGRKPALGALDFITEENVDRVVAAFRAIDKKGVDPQHIFYQIGSMGGFLGGGAFRQAIARAKMKAGPVYHYFFTFDAPHPRNPEKSYAWHTADLPLQMRVVSYEVCEPVSMDMARAWGAFIRTGSPSTDALPWPAFTEEKRECMVLDIPCHVEEDPTKPYRDALENIN